MPVVPPVQQPDPSEPPPITGPAIADDVDVIEREWVDKTKQVIEATKADPHAEEDAIEDLQVDYLKKRYGQSVKADNPDAAPGEQK
jgi:hypothetical protein